MSEQFCKHCYGAIGLRNPSGFCDHLYYPENCSECKADNPTEVEKLKKQLSQSQTLLEKAEEALKTVNPWCAFTHSHVTCDSVKIETVLLEIEKFKGKP